ncbi:putative quinol monooxygenase [Sphingopyxis terrae]|uniref:putative quinol monooxygenase n=1 Tax=Sphingopyxis terrae TaxID=33052 RepID=UPI003622502D
MRSAHKNDPYYGPRHPHRRASRAHDRARRRAQRAVAVRAGCLAHNCHIDVENPDRLTFVEAWESVDAVRDHFALPAARAFVADMRALSPQPPAIRIYAAEDITAKLMG